MNPDPMKILESLKQMVRVVLAPLLCVLLVVIPVLARDGESVLAQAAPQPAAPPQAPTPAPTQATAPAALPTVEDLKVLALAGKDEVNDIQRRVMAPLVVEVLDQNDRPVQNAEVVFRFPLQGPSATFAGGKTTLTAHTNGQGQVAAMNWMANNETGRFDVHVSASYGNEVGSVIIPMSNANNVPASKVGVGASAASGKKHGLLSSKWAKIALIGGAAAVGVGIYFATRGGGSKTAGSTVTITPGSPSVGGPH